MPLGFFSTLAAGIGLALFEGSKSRQSSIKAIEYNLRQLHNEHQYEKKYAGVFRPEENYDAYELSRKSLKELYEMYRELRKGELPPFVNIIESQGGEVNWDYKPKDSSELDEGKYCCILGILDAKGIPGNGMPSKYCRFCSRRGEKCRWAFNFSGKKMYLNPEVLGDRNNNERFSGSVSKLAKSRYGNPSSDLLYETQSAQALENRYLQVAQAHKEHGPLPINVLPIKKNTNNSLAKISIDDNIIKHCSVCGIAYFQDERWENPSCDPCFFCPDIGERCTQPYNQQLLLGVSDIYKSRGTDFDERDSPFGLNQVYKEKHKGESCPAVQIMEEKTGTADWYLREQQGRNNQINVIKYCCTCSYPEFQGHRDKLSKYQSYCTLCDKHGQICQWEANRRHRQRLQFLEGYHISLKKSKVLNQLCSQHDDLENLCKKEGLVTPIPTRDFTAYGKDVKADFEVTNYCCICYLLHKRKEPWEGILQTPCTFCPEHGRRCERYINRQLIERTYGPAAINYYRP